MEWQVLLSGDEYDLDELSKSFVGADLAIDKREDGFTIRWSGLGDLAEADAVREQARGVLELVNGAACLALHSRLPITVRSLVLIQADGSKIHHLHLTDTVCFRETATVTIVGADGTKRVSRPADPAVEWVRIGLRDKVVADVLRLVALKPLDWVNLYRILEIIGHDVGGRHGISGHRWATEAALDRFRHTANSRAAIGDEARHGKESTQPPSDPMTLPEARSLIETILHNWMRAKK
jgi:hypothetical protein